MDLLFNVISRDRHYPVSKRCESARQEIRKTRAYLETRFSVASGVHFALVPTWNDVPSRRANDLIKTWVSG